jgi:hypothetical protein
MDAVFERPVIGLPFRMIFLKSWHVLNAFIFFLGLGLFSVSTLAGISWLETTSYFVMGFPLACFALLPVMIILFIILEKIFE